MFTLQFLPSLAVPQMTRSPFPKTFMASTLRSSSKEAKDLKKLTSPTAYKVQAPLEQLEVFKSLEDWSTENILPLLKPVEKSWQPQDFVPDSTSEEFLEQVSELRERSKEIPDECLVILAASLITEEALPTYHSLIDSTGVCERTNAWGIWNRAWTAEENRHGDLLNRYLYLSGRVDMRQIEKTIQYLIGSGMDVGVGKSPYFGVIYTSFQERATFISHGNTAKLAMKHGDRKLAQICGTIAADEKRHGIAYARMVGKLFEVDPEGIMVSFAKMMKKKILMPAHLMSDGLDSNLYKNVSNISTRIGAYTALDYIGVLEELVDLWKVEKLVGLSSEAQEAQDFVCRLPNRLRSVAEKTRQEMKDAPMVPFSWIFNREV